MNLLESRQVTMQYDVVIVASGKGERAKLGYNKAFFKLKSGKTILEKSASLFIEDDDCKNVIVVTSEDYINDVFKHDKVKVTLGGKLRKDSVYNGLKLVKSEYVLIHDAARPFFELESLIELKDAIYKYDAAIMAKKAVDTIKVVNNGVIEKTIDRNTIYMAETPQGFKTSLIVDCYKRCLNIEFTDDASLLESLGYKVYIVEDKFDNKKLTSSKDFECL